MTREANSRFTEIAIAHIRENPFAYLVRGVRAMWVWSYFPGSHMFRDNAIVFVLFSLLQLAIIVCAILGLLTINRFYRVYLLTPVFALTNVLLFTTGISRFIIPAMPFVLLAAGQGFHWLWHRVAEFAGRKRKGSPISRLLSNGKNFL